jgi:mRNA interferase MazF
MNHHLRTVIVASMTTGGRPYPTRIPCTFRRTPGFVVLDQIRTVDTERLGRRLGVTSPVTFTLVLSVIREMFAG